ncbi:hypothetical protein BH09MYX1_BH09MYX1_35090 [soil metagenome]
MRFLSKMLFPFALALSAAALGACSSDDAVTPTPTNDAGKDVAVSVDSGSDSAANKDIVDTAIGAGNFTTLVAAVQAAGLESTLRGAGPFTVLAPTDAAFAKVPKFLLDELVTAPYKTELALILKYHVLPGAAPASALLGKKQDVASVLGAKVNIDGSGGKVVLDGTVNVTTPDVNASNGIIHVIDGVLLPTIVDTAVGYDDGKGIKFSTLVTAVTAADLGPTLSGPGTFTVFAPTDAAFEKLKTDLGAVAFNAILADKVKLAKILKYHVLATTVFAKDVTTSTPATVEGNTLKITVAGGKVTIADSTATVTNVVFTDLPNRNGVIHVIDKVLLPPNL